MLEKLNKAQRIAVICGVALAVAVFLVPGFMQVILVGAGTFAVVVALGDRE